MANDLLNRPNMPNSDGRGDGRQVYDEEVAALKAGGHLNSSDDDTSTGFNPTDEGFYNPVDRGPSKKKDKKAKSGKDKSLFKDSQGEGGSPLQNFKSSLMKRKWLAVLGIGGAGIATFILVLLIMLSALKIPHLVENITEYQFARVFQQTAARNERITTAKLAIDSADDGVYSKLKTKYGATMEKLEKYSPTKVTDNLKTNDGLRFNTEKTKLGRTRITSVTFVQEGKKIPLRSTSNLKNLTPGYKFVGNTNFAKEFAPQLKAALKADDIGPIVRGQVSKNIRKELGVGLVAWKVGEYTGKKPEAARLQTERNFNKAARGAASALDDIKSSQIAAGAKAAAAAETEAVAKDGSLRNIINNNGNINSVKSTIDKSVQSSWYQTGLSWVNPVYAVATPICIVYEGSVHQSGPTIDQQSSAQQRSFYLLASSADQQKDGTNSSAEAVGALNDKLGDISGSNPMRRASGNEIDTAGTPSGEAITGGTTTAFDVLFGGGTTASVANKTADKVCPIATDLKTAGLVALGNIVATIFSGGTSEVALETAGQTATKVITKSSTSLLGRLVEKAGAKKALNVSSKIKDITKDSVKSGVKIAAVTEIAKLIVASKAGYFNNGLEQGNDMANMADSGANINANEVQRQGFYGRPLSKSETTEATAANIQYAAELNSSKSTFSRYLAISNPNSLLTKFGTTLTSSSFSSIIGSLTNMAKNMFSPVGLFSSVASSGRSTVLAASNDASTQTYGNVQFGWSGQEQALMQRADYSMLENQYRLSRNSDKVAQIAEEYKPCFDSATSMGTLLSEEKIVRDDNGNVKESSGLCSPKNLGPNNPEYGDLVFRWRLAQSDDAGTNDLVYMQDITTDDSTSGPAGQSGVVNAEAPDNTKGSPVTTDTTTVLPDVDKAMARVKYAMSSAAGKLWMCTSSNSTSCYRQCDFITSHVWGWKFSGIADGAIYHWRALPASKKHAGSTNVPIGASMYWDTGAGKAGHVAIYVGNGSVLTNDFNSDGSYSAGALSYAPLSKIMKIGAYQGWGEPDGVGRDPLWNKNPPIPN